MSVSKLFAAHKMIAECMGTQGVWAAPERYDYQCWTRDFSMAVQPYLLHVEQHEIAKTHIMNLIRRQKPDGQIPILFLDGVEGHAHFIADKIRRTASSRKMSFMLRRYIEERGDVGQLTPGTKDSELHFVIAVGEFLEYCKNVRVGRLLSADEEAMMRAAAVRALSYIETNLLDGDGLLRGCDWRDTMEKQLGRVPLLSNNALLVHAYDLMGMGPEPAELRDTINDLFWRENMLLDWPDCDRKQLFDPLGASLAVLYDVIPKDRYPEVILALEGVDTPCGYTIQCRHNPLSPEEAEVIERTDGVVVWPFVLGFAVLALAKMYEDTGNNFPMARKPFRKFAKLDGLAEWYDPATGKGYGAKRQLWSAALFARADAVIEEQRA